MPSRVPAHQTALPPENHSSASDRSTRRVEKCLRRNRERVAVSGERDLDGQRVPGSVNTSLNERSRIATFVSRGLLWYSSTQSNLTGSTLVSSNSCSTTSAWSPWRTSTSASFSTGALPDASRAGGESNPHQLSRRFYR